jgi:flagellar biosynthesis protein FlhF
VNVRKFVAKSSREALQQVRQTLGPDALILSTRPLGSDVEIVAMPGEEMANIAHATNTVASVPSAPVAAVQADSGHRRVDAFEPPRVNDENVVRGPQAADKRRSERVRQYETNQNDIPQHHSTTQAPAGSAKAPVHGTPENATVMAELKAMRGLLETQLATLAWSDSLRRNPLRTKLTRLLLTAGFSPALARGALAKLPDDFSEEQGGKWLADVIARNVPVAEAEDNLVTRGGVYAIVGPTGVGKTTTTAKLAARCVVRFGADNLALVTTDSYRIGAQDQLRTYGKILGVPVHVVQDESGLAGAIASLRRKHLVLIDTVGMGQRDTRVIEQVSMLANSGAKRVLVLNATAHSETLEDVVQAFQGKALAGCIVSKADEAVRMGSVLDTILRHRLTVHFVANGQRVPEDMHEPNAQYLVHRALKAPAPAQAFRLAEEDFPLLMPGADFSAEIADGEPAHA